MREFVAMDDINETLKGLKPKPLPYHLNKIKENAFYIKYLGPDGNQYIYFYDGGSPTGAYIKWDDALGRFIFSHPIQATLLGDADTLDGQHGAFYLARANHTGTQVRATISDFAHKDTHVSGGADQFVAADILEATGKRLQESSGPTTLVMGAVANNQLLKRNGASIDGISKDSGSGLGDIVVTKITFA